MRCRGYCRCASFGNYTLLQRMSSLRVERHPRGHVASCNGRVELLNTRVEPYKALSGEASENATMMDMLAKKERERKAHQLESFQKRVKHRVFQREREKQLEMATASTQVVQAEQRAAERAVKLDRIKVIVNLFHFVFTVCLVSVLFLFLVGTEISRGWTRR